MSTFFELKRRMMFQREEPDITDGYITDGLIFRVDGIRNSLMGHKSTLTEWEDLSGNGQNCTFYKIQNGSLVEETVTANSDSITFNAARIARYMAGSSSSPLYINRLASTEGTLEVVCQNTNGTIGVAVALNNYTHEPSKGLWFRPSSNHIISSLTEETSSTYIAHAIYATSAYIKEKACFQFFYTSGTNYSTNQYKNNATSGTGVTTTGTLSNRSSISIGARYHTSSTNYYGLTGKIYAVRLYNRTLTNAERLNNYTIDQTRFGGI